VDKTPDRKSKDDGASAAVRAGDAQSLTAGIPRAKTVIMVLLLASVLPAFNGSALNVAIPTIGAEFHSPTAALGWIVAGYTICCLTLALPIGRLSDLTSRRTVFIVGIFLLSLTAGATVFSSSLESVIAFRLGQGIGSACLFATTIAIINNVFPPQRRGQMLGISVAATYAGLSAGPVLGGLLTYYAGWRSVFVFLMIFGIITGIIAAVSLPKRGASAPAPAAPSPASAPAAPPGHNGDGSFVSREDSGESILSYPDTKEPSPLCPPLCPPTPTPAAPSKSLRQRMDPLGILLFSLAVVCIALGLNLVADNPLGWLGMVVGTGVLLIFIRHENRAAEPLVAPALFKNGPNFLLSSLSALFNYSATFAVSYLVSIYLQQVMDLSAAISGLILITSPLMQTLITPFSGRLSDRYSPFRLASVGMAICAVGLVLLVVMTYTASLVHVFVSLIILGVGFGIFSPPNTNAIMSQAPRQHAGVASSFVSTMRNGGQLVSMAVIGIVMTATFGQVTIVQAAPDAIALATRVCCIIFVGFCVAGIFTSLQRRSRDYPSR
jgi:MFS family permease